MTQRPPLLKRKFLIDPKVQLKVVMLLGGIALVSAFAVCAIAYERLLKLGVLFNNSIVPPIMLPKHFEQVANSLMLRLIGIVGLMVIVFVFAGIYLTHQLAGPIWKTQSHLKKFLNGEKPEHMRFRRNDAFQELPDLVNKLTDGYKK